MKTIRLQLNNGDLNYLESEVNRFKANSNLKDDCTKLARNGIPATKEFHKIPGRALKFHTNGRSCGQVNRK